MAEKCRECFSVFNKQYKNHFYCTLRCWNVSQCREALRDPKVCKGCRQEKPLSGFGVRRYKNRPPSISGRCVVCAREVNRIKARQQLEKLGYFEYKASKWKHRYGIKNISPRALLLLWRKQKGRCGLSGRKLNRESAEIDHIIPVSKGGSPCLANIRWVIFEANRAKRDLLDADFLSLCMDIVKFKGTNSNES